MQRLAYSGHASICVVLEAYVGGWGVLGCGGVAILHGRRRVLQSVLFCCMILFCRVIYLAGGGGF